MRCGLGFVVEEIIEGGFGSWEVLVQPYNDECEKVSLPKTKEEFVWTAAALGIEWDIDEVISIEEFSSF